jgi:uncharacterized protein (TIGR02145 family)
MKKLFSFCLICFMALSASAQQMEFVDLGLPSGTLWKAVDEPGLYTYDEATSQFGNQLPTNTIMEELKRECVWSWNGNGYHVTGPNGNFITLPASGYRDCNGNYIYMGLGGYYWSSKPYSTYADGLYFLSSYVGMSHYYRAYGYSVRCVQE